MAYFRLFARLQLKKVSPLVIGITGSAGKTSTLQACEAVLTDHVQLKVSHKANSQSGIPLNILDLHITNYTLGEWLLLAIRAPLKVIFSWPSYTHYLVEMGIDGPDEPSNMSYLLKIIRPQVAVFLNVAPTHTEPFDHLVRAATPATRRHQLLDLIAAEKGKLITTLPASATAILNQDEPLIMRTAQQTKADVTSFGTAVSADLRVVLFTSNKNGVKCVFNYADDKEKIIFSEYVLPKSYAASFAAALAVGISQKLSLKQAITSLQKNFKLPPGRSSLIPAINQATILDSSYNASTTPMLDMLELLKETAPKRKLALLGDMRELGEVTQLEHERVAAAAAKICDAVYLVGPSMKQFALPKIKQSNTPVQWFENAYMAAEHLSTVLKKDDLLLVKGSQNTLLLEIAVERLMANPADAAQLLCRRGAYWDAVRKAIVSP